MSDLPILDCYHQDITQLVLDRQRTWFQTKLNRAKRYARRHRQRTVNIKVPGPGLYWAGFA